ncbi:MAG TPA: Sir2 family NAD-dependent protein deacetylase, partial [Verrucomicrobiota bacterium]|nr:Sir2 family NAD-dependent protein deacetylase [Verrucomicrobiota bacterium]
MLSPTSMKLENSLSRAAEAVGGAQALLITAGAGLGVDSGLPDFRGTEGFWRAYPVVARLGLSFAQMANPSWFERDPHMAWAFYGHRLNLYRRTVPHAGFGQLLHWSAAKPHGSFVFTSNVDGHFQRAGFDSRLLAECHGSIHHLQCVRPCRDEIWSADETIVTVDEETFRAADPLPTCPFCGELARPNVLMFGDARWIPERAD